MTTPAPATMSRSLAAPVFGVILLLLFGFAFSEEVITVVLEAFGRDDSAAPAVEIVVDAATLLVVGLLKRRIDRIDGGVRDCGAGGGPASSSSWLCDVVLVVLGGHPGVVGPTARPAAGAGRGVVLASSLNADPMTLFSARRRAEMPLDWQRVRAVVPLVIGSYAAYAGAALWWDYRSLDVMRQLDPQWPPPPRTSR